MFYYFTGGDKSLQFTQAGHGGFAGFGLRGRSLLGARLPRLSNLEATTWTVVRNTVDHDAKDKHGVRTQERMFLIGTLSL